MNTKTVLITGASGFVGRNFDRVLSQLGWEVDRCDVTFGWGVHALTSQSHKVYDLVIHAAAAGPNRAAIDREPENFPYNVSLDAMMIAWAMRTQQRHFIYLSSSAVYSDEARHPTLGGKLSDMRMPFYEADGHEGKPYDSYGLTKRIGEQMVQAAQSAGLRATVVRPFSGYGTDQSEDFPFGAFVARAKRNDWPFTIWGSADQVRDFIHIDDIVHGTLALMDWRQSLLPINLCTGRPTSMLELAKLVCKTAGYTPEFHVDEQKPLGVSYRVGSPASLLTYYHPKVTLEEGVRRAFEEAR